jgi:peptidoglycan/LPS O-acetylase OafA/YrhL
MLHSGSDVLLFGCLLAIGMIRYPDWVKKLILPTWAATCLILFTFILVWVPDIPPISSYPKIWADANYTIEPLIWTIIIANILLQPEAWYTRFLKTPVLVFLGTISYSLYLWQQLFCYAGINTTFTGEFPINIFCSIGLAWLSYKFIERPFLLLKSKNYSHTVQEKATAPSPTSPARRESMPST